jgi:hypothetical protein
MSDSFASSAAREFVKRHPLYIVNKHNAGLMSKEVVRLVDEEGRDPASVFTYNEAFQNLQHELELKEVEATKSYHEMTEQELLALPAKEQDRLPADILRRVANYEMAKLRQKPQISEHTRFLTEVFEEMGIAYSPANIKIVHEWMEERKLGLTSSNIRLAICDCEDALAPSEKVLNEMSSKEFLETVVKPEHARRQSEQKPRQPNWPVGFRYVSWLHDQ